MLSLKHRFLFLHVPKTGGNSIQNILAPWSDDRLVCLAPHQDGVERFEVRSDRFRTTKHSTLAEYLAEYGEDLFHSLYKFCCVRNPWDRAVSFYFSPHRGKVEWDPDAFAAFVPTIQPLRHFVALGTESRATLEAAVGNLDQVLRFESLPSDFEALCRRLGLPQQGLPHRNHSRRSHYRDYYDHRTRELVREHLGEEAALFRYEY